MDPHSIPKTTVIIPNWNTQHWIRGCLDGLRAQTFQDFQIILVDNGSTDDSVAFVKEIYPEVKIIAFANNKGFAPAANAGIKESCSDYVALLNVDTVPQPTWLNDLVVTIEHSPDDVGAVTSKMLSMADPNIIDDAGNELSWYGSAHKRGLGESAKNYDQQEKVFSVSGGASLFRRSFLEEVDYFDEGFITYLEDIDLGLRGRLLGYQFLYVPTAKVLHQWRGASIPRPRYVYLCTRNRLALLLKNIPWSLLLKHSLTLIYGQIYFFIVYKKPFYSLAGTAAFFATLPKLLRERHRIQKRKKISNHTLDDLLSQNLYEPSLGDIIKNRLRRT